MPKSFIYLLFCIPLVGCEVTEEKPVSPTPELANSSSSADMLEIQALFEQDKIDPLTRYLHQYTKEADKQVLLERVYAEREKRCQRIGKRYAQRAKTQKNLQRLMAGYQYSCPTIVEAFARRLEQASMTQAPADISTTEPEAPSPVEANGSKSDCLPYVQKQQFTQALKPCLSSAAAGDLQAQLALAEMYETGLGVDVDDMQAVHWYQKAAQQGSRQAQSELGVRYYTGSGVVQDYQTAAHWQQKAAAQGHPEAQFILGVMYEMGRGVPEDFVLAYKWFVLAASRGAKGAVESRRNLASKLTPEQIEEGQRLARQWSAKAQVY